MTAPSDALAARRAELERRLAALSPEKRALLERGDSLAAPAAAPPAAAGPRPRPAGARVPMSFAQELLWRLELAQPGHGYNVPRVARLRGPLDLAALGRALDALVARHEALRTTFDAEGGEPQQRVHPPRAVPLDVVDLRAVAPESREAEAVDRVRAMTRRPFDLARDLQLRAAVVRLADDDQVLVLESHHVVADTVSRGVMLRELAALYAGFRDGAAAVLAPLPLQYGDFARWQREQLAGDRLERLLAYWRERLGGVPPLELPTDRPRSSAPSFEGATRSAVLPPELGEAVRRLSRERGATTFMTILAAFTALLARYGGQDDVVVGSPIAGRAHADLENVIGYFINTLVLRTSVAGDPTFAELLGRVRETALGAYEHQDVPYETLVAELRDAGRTGGEPLFNVLFALQDPERGRFTLPGTEPVAFGASRGATKFDLFLSVADAPDGLRTYLEYRTDLFDAATVDRMLAHLGTLLAGAVARPDERLSRLPLMDAGERARVLERFNATALDYPRDADVPALFATQAARTPGAPAVTFGDETLSYAELDARVGRLATRLRALGVGPERVVAVHLERSARIAVALLAVQRAGGAYLPLDPDYPHDRLEYMLADSGATALLTEDALAGTLAFGGATLSMDDAGDADLVSLGDEPRDPERLAYLIYTSGSTGKPKGVAVTQRNLVNFLAGFDAVVPLGPGATLVAVTPLSFDISGLELYLPLVTGARVVVAARETGANPAQLAELLRASGATHLQATPATWRMLVEDGWAGQRGLVAICGGEALTPALASALLARGLELWNVYGPTEATIWATMQRVAHAGAASAGGAVAIGRPMANVRCYVLDAALAPCPVGVPGELWIAGDGVARGYHERPELTAEKFAADPFSSGGRMYRTGDRARWREDGALDFHGRLDHQVKLRGHRIELGEIEHALAEQAGVAAAVAVVREDAPGDARLVAYVVPRDDAGDDAEGAAVAHWADVWDEAYTPGAGAPDAPREPGFNTAGWNDSYTGREIAAPEMREWLERTVERMLASGPRRVLDVGVGTGLFLFRVAPHVEHYAGVDSAGEALRAIRRDPSFGSLGSVALHEARADELAARFAPASFDLVVINSVVQYFPSAEYLVDVLTQAASLVAPGGMLFVGDVRALPLLETFHASVSLAHAPDSLGTPDLRARVRQRLANERELVIDPALFHALAAALPAVRGLRILTKRGVAANELTKFRYDVAYRLGGSVPSALDAADVTATGLDDVRRALDARPAALRVRDLLDRRLAADLRTEALLADDAAPPTAGAVRALAARAPGGLDVEALAAVHPDYVVELRWPESGRPGHLDAVLTRRDAQGEVPAPARAVAPRPWSEYVHHHAADVFDPARVAAWRDALGARLPDYMVPATFVRLDALPLTPNGKVDRKALPAPSADVGTGAAYVAPRTLAEAQLVEVWEDVLQRRPIGVRDDFFALGGHSLLALRVLSRLAERFGHRLPLRALFDAPTVEQLAATLDAPGDAAPVADDAIPRGASDEAPLSFGQEVLWLVQRAAPALGTYNMPEQWTVEGPLDADALERALGALVARHEALRTTFATRDGAPVQVIGDARPALERLSVEHLAPEAREAAARALLRERAGGAFDLARDLPLRAALVRLAPERHALLVVTHHIVSDGWSRGVMLRELGALYRGELAGAPAELPALPIRYADFAAWQRARLHGAAYERQLRYWTDTLAGSTLAVDVPTDRPRATAPRFAGARRTVVFPPELLARLRGLARERDATLFMVLLAAFQALLHRYSGQADVVVGTAVAGRARAELEGLVGYFVNTLALRTRFDGDPTFAELVDRVRHTQLGAAEHADVPFEQVTQALRGAGDAGPAPVCQVMFVLQNNAGGALRLGDATLRGSGAEIGAAKFELYLSMGEQADGLRAALQYRTDLFDDATAERMLRHLHVLLDAAAAAPGTRVSHLPLMDAEERALVVDRFNATAVPYERDATIHALFAEQAARAPHAVAVVADGARVTYGELAARVDALAARLAARGVRPGHRVALCVQRSAALPVALLAVLRCGAAYVPLDPAYPPSRLALMLADADAPVVLAQPALAAVVDAAALAAGVARERLLIDDAGAAAHADPSGADSLGAGATGVGAALDAAYVMYTSGSTGRPKGVVVPHRAVVRLVRHADYAALGPDDAVLGFAPIAFDASTFEIWGALLNGGRLVLAPAGLPDLASLGELVERERVTTLWLTAALFQQVVDAGLGHYRGVRRLLAGGDVLPVPHVRAALAALPDVTLVNGYGPTENTTFTCCWAVPRDWPADAPIPIGRPIANSRVYVLDAHGEPVPVGVPGELHAAGDGIALGYLGNEALTAEKFVADPFDSLGGRMYRTGDRARWRADGVVEFMGRLDEQVKIRGFRVEPGEVEAALAAHPAVREAAVVARPAPAGGARLVGYYVPRDGAPLAPAVLRSYLRERLPDYMVPASVVALAAMPVGATGKLDRRALPDPGLEAAEAEQPYVAPRTDAEAQLARMWGEVLGLERVGVDRNFFELGGHSLTAMRIMSRVQETLGVRLPLTAVFERPTIARLAELVDAQRGAAAAPAEQGIARVARTAQRRPGAVTRPGGDA